MRSHNFIVFDCETGGMDKENNFHAIKCPITQIALISLDGSSLNEITRYESYIKGRYVNNKYVGYSTTHDQEYQQGALTSTGITIEKLEAEGQDSKKVCLDIIEFFKQSKSKSNFHKLILIGHNVGYDIPFLQYLFKLHKKDLSDYLQGHYDHTGTFTPACIDTMYLSRFMSLDDTLKHSLINVAEREGIELIDAHNAMNDTVATMEVFKRYLLKLRNKSSFSAKSQQQSSFRENFKFEY